MIKFDYDDSIILAQQEALEQALSTNPKTQKALQKLIRKVIAEARVNVMKSIKFDNGDPHHAVRSIRTAVYKKILGANINIYNSRKAHGPVSVPIHRTLKSGQRGGNRRSLSERTKRIQEYGPLDRGFILRWVNEGMTRTNPRIIDFTPDDRRKVDRWNKHPNTGNRSSISARHFFKNAGERALVKAADNLANLIDAELANMLNKKK